MISKNHIQNIFDRSNTELSTNGEFYILKVTLPNGYTIATTGEEIDLCVKAAKDKIGELESYLERDKVFYGYDLGNEYE